MNYRESQPTAARALRIAGRELPPVRRIRFRLRLTRRARFHFYHGGVLRGLLSCVLSRHELPAGLIPFAGELGRVAYEAGDAYHFGVTLLGDSGALVGELEHGLRRLGARRPNGSGAPPVLGGNFELASADELAVADPSAIAAAWDSRGSVPVRFLAPLRLRRPAGLRRKGAAFLNQDCFPADHFLERLWNRLFRASKRMIVLADPVYTPEHPQLARGRTNALPIAVLSPADLDVGPLARSVRAFAGGLGDLPFTRQEAARIVRHLDRDDSLLLLDFSANRSTVLSGLLADYDIVHFAGHGLFNPIDPEISGLVLSLFDRDGRRQAGLVRPHELRELDLRADLVTLSACRTGRGRQVDGEGLLGVTRAFLYAGARRVVVSSWNIHDGATAELMDFFYEAHLREGLPPAAALRQAKLRLRADPRWSAPAYWGAFSLHGDWR